MTLQEKQSKLEELLSGEIDAATFEQIKALQAEIKAERMAQAADAAESVHEVAAHDELAHSETVVGTPKQAARVVGFAGESAPFVKKDIITDDGYKFDFVRYLKSRGRLVTKTLMEGVDSSGGFLVPEEFIASLIQRRPSPNRLRNLVQEIPTSRDVVTLPSVEYNASDADIYPSGIRAKFVGERVSTGEASVTEPVFGTRSISVGTWMMELPVTNDLVEDSVINLVEYITSAFRIAADLLIEDQILNGTGVSGRPTGIMLNPGATGFPGVVLSSTANNIDADQVRTIPFAVAEQYIENSVWVMNRRVTGSTVATFKDSNEQYLFNFGRNDSGLASGIPEQLVGFPIVWSPFMPNPGDGQFPILFGNMTGYKLVMRRDVSIQVLTEVGARENLVWVIARMRFGGAPLEPWSMVIGKSDNA